MTSFFENPRLSSDVRMLLMFMFVCIYVFNCVYGGKGGAHVCVCVHACMFSCTYILLDF